MFNTKFDENPSTGSRVLYGQTTDLKKLIFAFRNFGNSLKTCSFSNKISLRYQQ